MKTKLSSTKKATSKAHYGLDERQLVRGIPPLSGTHDAAYYAVLNKTGLVKTWNFLVQRLTVGGRWFAIATLGFFAFGTASLELQSYIPLCYAFCLWGVALLAMWRLAPRAKVLCRHAERICAGETLRIEIEVENRARAALLQARVLPHRLPPQLEAVPTQGTPLPSLARGEQTRVQCGLHAPRRGVYQLRGVRLDSDFPFGLLHASQTTDESTSLLVYPPFHPLRKLEIPSGRRHHPGGVALAASRGDSFEFWGNREWRQGDTLRDIDWRATARLRRPLEKPVVREYREEFLLRVAIVLDTHVPHGNEQAADEFESAVSLCAACGDFMARQDYLVDILAAGPHLYHLTAGRSLAYLDQILDILACVESSTKPTFELLEPEIDAHLSQITTVICVLLDWTMQRRAFVQRLVEQGAAVKVLIVRDTPCTFDPAADTDWIGHAPLLSRSDVTHGITEL